MDITPFVAAGRQLIQAYGDGGFRIAGSRHEGSVVILPERTLAWPVGDASSITFESLALVAQAEDRPAILLIGMGRSMAPLPRALKAELRAAGMVAEPMDTGAACRTYNVLLTEGRAVAAALIAV